MSDSPTIQFHPIDKRGKDRTGERFGLWTVLGYAGALHWWCQCQCGKTRKQDIKSLRKGRTKSCVDCSHADAKNRIGPPRLQRTMNGMMQRCYNPKGKRFKHYGAKGITVCDEWRNDYSKFVAWALSSGYRDDLTIERKDNSKGYCPENCTWIPHGDQAKNRTDLVLIGDGEERTYRTEFARKRGIKPIVLRDRLRGGMSLENALTYVPPKQRSRNDWGRFAEERR